MVTKPWTLLCGMKYHLLFAIMTNATVIMPWPQDHGGERRELGTGRDEAKGRPQVASVPGPSRGREFLPCFLLELLGKKERSFHKVKI